MNNKKNRIKMLLVFGTRPEAIKMCPLIKELQSREEVRVVIAVSGQHREMLDQVLEVFHITPDYDLAIMKDSQTLFDITNSILIGIKKILQHELPDLVLVHGDTSTTFATALAAFYLQIPVAHIEAGLRTYDITSPYPEEFNREAVGIISSYNFVPTKTAKENLLREGKSDNCIWITGNTVIDALKTTVSNSYHHKELEWSKDSRLILITAHRRENLGEPLYRMFRAIRRCLELHDDVKAIYPIHMNPMVRKAAHEVFDIDNSPTMRNKIHIIEPLDVIDFHNFMAHSHLILTDSGGIQEEAPSLGVPVLVMRNNTERPEGVEAGVLKIVGTNEDNIFHTFNALLNNEELYLKMVNAVNPYGDGRASARIADVLIHGCCSEFSGGY